MKNLTSSLVETQQEVEQTELNSILEYLKQAIVETQEDAREFSRIQDRLSSVPPEVAKEDKSVDTYDFCSELKLLILELKKANAMNSSTLQHFRKLI